MPGLKKSQCSRAVLKTQLLNTPSKLSDPSEGSTEPANGAQCFQSKDTPVQVGCKFDSLQQNPMRSALRHHYMSWVNIASLASSLPSCGIALILWWYFRYNILDSKGTWMWKSQAFIPSIIASLALEFGEVNEKPGWSSSHVKQSHRRTQIPLLGMCPKEMTT